MAGMDFKKHIKLTKKYGQAGNQLNARLFDLEPCSYCNKTMHFDSKQSDGVSVDHLCSKSDYKKYVNGLVVHRFVMCCRQCNSDKSDKMLLDWIAQLVIAHDPRATFVQKVYNKERKYYRIIELAKELHLLKQTDVDYYNMTLQQRRAVFRRFVSERMQTSVTKVHNLLHHFTTDQVVKIS